MSSTVNNLLVQSFTKGVKFCNLPFGILCRGLKNCYNFTSHVCHMLAVFCIMHYIIITCYIYPSIVDAHPLLSKSSSPPHGESCLHKEGSDTNYDANDIPTGFHLIHMLCTKIIKHFICVGMRKELGQYKLSG